MNTASAMARSDAPLPSKLISGAEYSQLSTCRLELAGLGMALELGATP